MNKKVNKCVDVKYTQFFLVEMGVLGVFSEGVSTYALVTQQERKQFNATVDKLFLNRLRTTSNVLGPLLVYVCGYFCFLLLLLAGLKRNELSKCFMRHFACAAQLME